MAWNNAGIGWGVDLFHTFPQLRFFQFFRKSKAPNWSRKTKAMARGAI